MGEALMQMYDTMTETEQKELYDFALFIVSKRKKEKTASQSHIDKFFGILSDEDAKIMLEAVDECRKIEGSDER